MKLSTCTMQDLFFALLSIASTGRKAVALSERGCIGVYPSDDAELLVNSSLCFAYLDPIDTEAEDFSVLNCMKHFANRFPKIHGLGTEQNGNLFTENVAYCQLCGSVSEHLDKCSNCQSDQLWVRHITYPLYVFGNGRTFIPLITGEIEFSDSTIVHVDSVSIPIQDMPLDRVCYGLIKYLMQKADYIITNDKVDQDIRPYLNSHQEAQIINAEIAHIDFQVREWSDAGL